jgi:hypothetical protein
MRKYKFSRSILRVLLHEVYPILRSVNRQHELTRLIAWAKRKNLSNPLQLYSDKLVQEEARVLRYRMHNTHLVALAYLIHRVAYGVFPPPQYHRRGAARGYRLAKR